MGGWTTDRGRTSRSRMLLALAVTIASALLASATTASGASSYQEPVSPIQPRAGTLATSNPYGWATNQLRFADQIDMMPAHIVSNPGRVTTRWTLLIALRRLESYRAQRFGTPTPLADATAYTRLSDQPDGSLAGKAVRLGWFAPVNGAFAAGRPVTANEASRAIVLALGLRTTYAEFARRLRAEAPRARFNQFYAAAQVLARDLDMRYNHPEGTEQHEIAPHEAMPIAHTAYMLTHGALAAWWEVDNARRFERFSLPTLNTYQQQLVNRAFTLIGQPYVWAGEDERNGLSGQPQGVGGFDCSGFVTRVLTSAGVPESRRVTALPRTSYDMSNIKTTYRIRAASLRAGDLMFFGTNGVRSTPSQNYHVGMYLGSGWLIHSTGSNDGVSINSFDGWYADSFSWGRRVLR